MRATMSLILCFAVCGCAVVENGDDDGFEALSTRFEKIESVRENGIEHGVITAKEIHQRSDIVVMPPSVQHVVWKRGEQSPISAPTAVVGPVEPEREVTRKEPQKTVLDSWPVLEEDGDFSSTKDWVDMCQNESDCGQETGCSALIPCKDPGKYECFSTKQGSYCLEVVK